MKTIKERLSEAIYVKKLKRNTFCKSIGLSHGYLNNTVTTMQSDKLVKIAELYPDINLIWLITGKGEMFNGKPGDEKIVVGVEDDSTKAALDVLKDELSETRAKLIKCLEEKERVVTRSHNIGPNEPT